MKNPLATYYLNNIERNFKRRYVPRKGYTWEEYKVEFNENTGHSFDELKYGSVIKAKYMYELNRKKIREHFEESYAFLDKEKAKYHDENGTLIDEKWKKLIDERNKEIGETNSEVLTFFKEGYVSTEYEITGEFNESLTNLFSELVTYQSQIHVYEDSNKERINIFILDYNPDCYNHHDAINRLWGGVYFMRREYWPKDKYSEMEEGLDKLRKYGIENCKTFKQVIDMFPYVAGTENWVKYYFNKLEKEELEKYKQYDFYINFMIYSPITGFGGDNLPGHFVKGKINWD